MELVEKEILHRSFMQILNGIKTMHVMNKDVVNAVNNLQFCMNVQLNEDRNKASDQEKNFLLNINIMEN